MRIAGRRSTHCTFRHPTPDNLTVPRVMLCGSMAMIKDVAVILEAQGLREGSNADPGDFVLERAFVG
jgi:hypothetical protein